MTVVDTDIEDIVRAVWGSLFDIALRTDGAACLGAESTVTACVQIDGAWQGAVLLQCPSTLASTLTAAMFQATATPPFADVRDAMGELANIVAGNIKSLLPERCHISLPAVALGSHQHFSILSTETVACVSFICDGQPLLVTLLQQSNRSNGSRT
jgi:chemotaxis protein CheX